MSQGVTADDGFLVTLTIPLSYNVTKEPSPCHTYNVTREPSPCHKGMIWIILKT